MSYNLSEYGLSLIQGFQSFDPHKNFVADLSQSKTKKRHNSLLYNLLCRY